MKRIVIFSGSEAGLDEILCMVEKEFGKDGLDCSLTAFFDSKKLMNFLDANSSAVDIVLFDLCRQSHSYIGLADTLSKYYPDIDLLYISKPLYTFSEADRSVTMPEYILSTPLSFDDLQRPLSKAVTALTKYDSGKLTLFTKSQVYRLRHSRIDYIVSSNRQLTFHGGENVLCVYGKLNDVEQELGEDFLRCHQSYLVNINRIMEFGKLSIKLITGVRVPVSKSRYEKAYAAFLRYTGCTGIGECGCK
ncbi:hypothetical protein SDC9_62522 [bioreactor metagenome]|uniref:HTH LytTR-type domain-containing protein n=1 Tax=bioreactor metagenome TaxID=1076179 RepID=A0A644XIW2_9ZZZZ